LTVLFEDNHLIAVFKRPGQTVQPEPGKPLSLEEETKQFIKEKYNKPGAVYLGVIHRIDMPVSGIVIFAKTSKALTRMNEIFHDRAVKKTYRCIVEGTPSSNKGHLVHWLRQDPVKNFTKAFESKVSNAAEAKLSYEVLKQGKGKCLLEINLETGRKHQIRAQLSAMGCPIVGDVKYGASKPLADQSIALQSFSLAFVHPVKNEPVSFNLSQIAQQIRL